jgi:hypothetical protein
LTTAAQEIGRDHKAQTVRKSVTHARLSLARHETWKPPACFTTLNSGAEKRLEVRLREALTPSRGLAARDFPAYRLEEGKVRDGRGSLFSPVARQHGEQTWPTVAGNEHRITLRPDDLLQSDFVHIFA